MLKKSNVPRARFCRRIPLYLKGRPVVSAQDGPSGPWHVGPDGPDLRFR
jgi:hypothetical protein